jgi:hypothetical protein
VALVGEQGDAGAYAVGAMSIRVVIDSQEWPIGRIGEGDTEKSYSRYHSRVGCVDKRWLSTGGTADNACLSARGRDLSMTVSLPVCRSPLSMKGANMPQRWYYPSFRCRDSTYSANDQ